MVTLFAKMEKKSLGEILIKQKLIKQADLETAFKEQRETDKLLGAILLEKGLLTRENLTEALALQNGIESISLSRMELSPEIIKTIPERLSKRFLAIAIDRKGKTLKVAMADPFDIIAVDTLRSITGYEIKTVKGKGEEILATIGKYYYGFSETEESPLELTRVESDRETDKSEITFQADDPPVIKFVNLLLVQAIEKRASDIHLEPREKTCSLRFRIDGILNSATAPPVTMFPGIVSRIKILSGLDIAERRRPQDGRCEVKIGQKVLDLRISTFPTVFGEKIVMRVLDRSSLVPNLQELGMEVDQMEKLQKALKKPYGVVLITGPTGAGKTTTLYAALSHLNSPKKNIVTLEDPVEYRLEGINQAQVRPEIGLTFANYLRHVLRQDPNIIMVGEIRDAETAEIAVRAALTGHLVLSTIHTNDSVSTITRLIDMGVEPYLLQPALHLVVAQRLIRKLCPECKEPAPPSNLLPAGTTVYRPKGCHFCSETGYWGRIGIFEVLEVTPRLKELFMQKANYGFLHEEAKKDGMKTLFDVALSKAAEGVTSLEEVLGVVENP